jgi:hypothetical protein
VQPTNLALSGNNQEEVRLPRRSQHVLEENLILPLPDTGLVALEYTIDQPLGIVRVEAAG